MTEGRAYSAYTYNVEKLVPWRTLTGRQHFYLDHEMYLAYGGKPPHLQAFPEALRPTVTLKETLKGGDARVLNCPHTARQVAHPLHLHGEPSDVDAIKRLRAGLDERGRRRGARDQ